MATATRYIEAVGRRKTATARVRITPVSKDAGYVVNERPLAEHFQLDSLQQIATVAFADWAANELDAKKVAISRLGDELRVAGTIEAASAARASDPVATPSATGSQNDTP